MQVGTTDGEEGHVDIMEGHVATVAVARHAAQQEPAGLGPASECLAQMQNLRKVWLASQDPECS